MALPATQLEAFVCVAQSKSFSEAARRLHLTQSALSQRVLNLEMDLETSLFIRESSGPRLTETGARLLQYCRQKNFLEEEFLSEIKAGKAPHLSGLIKIATFSSHGRSILLPQISSFCRKHPSLKIEISIKELRELPQRLKSSQSDFIFHCSRVESSGVENHFIGFEENVLIQSKNFDTIPNTYLDHDENDTTTYDFLKLQKTRPPKIQRSYFDDVYAVIDAVESGLGQAVVPRHLVSDNKKVKIVEKMTPLKIEIFLSFYRQAFYTDLQKALIPILSKKITS
jgi:DNA-binding transcriptional LysR family regulator